MFINLITKTRNTRNRVVDAMNLGDVNRQHSITDESGDNSPWK